MSNFAISRLARVANYTDIYRIPFNSDMASKHSKIKLLDLYLFLLVLYPDIGFGRGQRHLILASSSTTIYLRHHSSSPFATSKPRRTPTLFKDPTIQPTSTGRDSLMRFFCAGFFLNQLILVLLEMS